VGQKPAAPVQTTPTYRLTDKTLRCNAAHRFT